MAEKKRKHQKNEEQNHEEILKDLEDQLKRSVADYRNLEKRLEEEKREWIKFANKELLLQLLPAFETLFLAESYIEDEGLKLTVRRLSDILESVGVSRVRTNGENFNPETMECIEVVEGEENKVVQETKPGFTLYGKLLIPAQVKVGK